MRQLIELFDYHYCCETSDNKAFVWMGIYGTGWQYKCIWDYNNE